MKNKNIFWIKGSVGLIAIIIAAILAIGGGVYFAVKKSPEQKTAETVQNISDIGASIPDLNFSLSQLPDLNVSSLNVNAGQISTNNVFSAPSIDTNFSYTQKVEFSLPSTQINIPIPTIPANIPKTTPTSETPPAASQGSESSGPPSDISQPSSIDC